MNFSRLVPVMFAVAAVLTACGKQETVATRKKWDPAYIAAEADKGNVGPASELNDACSKEVKETGRRGEACGAQDKVRELVKPIHVRF